MHIGSRVTPASSLAADRIDLVKDDYMQIRVISLFLLFSLCWSEQISDLFLRPSNKLIENLWTIDDLGFIAVESLGNLSSNQSFSCAWWPVQKHTFAVLDAVLFDDSLRVASGIESASKNFCKLLIESADTQLLETHVLLEDLLGLI